MANWGLKGYYDWSPFTTGHGEIQTRLLQYFTFQVGTTSLCPPLEATFSRSRFTRLYRLQICMPQRDKYCLRIVFFYPCRHLCSDDNDWKDRMCKCKDFMDKICKNLEKLIDDKRKEQINQKEEDVKNEWDFQLGDYYDNHFATQYGLVFLHRGIKCIKPINAKTRISVRWIKKTMILIGENLESIENDVPKPRGIIRYLRQDV